MVGAEDHPASEGEANVEEEGADEEPEHVGRRALHREDEHVVGPEEAQVAQDPEPDETVAGAEHEAAHVPHVAHDGPALDELLDDGAHDDEAVVGADHDVPQVEELAALLHGQHPVVVARQEHRRLVLQQLRAEQRAEAEQQRGHGQQDHEQVQEDDEGCVHRGPGLTENISIGVTSLIIIKEWKFLEIFICI